MRIKVNALKNNARPRSDSKELYTDDKTHPDQAISTEDRSYMEEEEKKIMGTQRVQF